MKKFLTGNYMIVAYIVVAFLLVMGIISLLLSGTLSKYSAKKTFNHNMTTNQFYFVSNKLKEDGNAEIINNYNGEEIEFNIKNGVNTEYTKQDINYNLSCEVPSGYKCYIDNNAPSSFSIVNDANSNGILERGDEIAIGTEHFYVVSNTNNHVVALAKYNLNVGSVLVPSAQVGIQNSLAKGFISSSDKYGTVAFSNGNGWSRQTNINISDYNGAVKSALYGANGYEKYIQSTFPSASIRLLNSSEATSLGIRESTYQCSAPSWARSTSYWLGTSYSTTNVLAVRSTCQVSSLSYLTDTIPGVRPVVEFDLSSSATTTTNTITHTNSVITKSHKIRVENISGSLDKVEAVVTATSTSPYVRTINGTFVLNIGGNNVNATVAVLMDAAGYCVYSIKNSGSQGEYITASFDTTKFTLEEGNTMYQNMVYYTTDANNNYNSITAYMPALSFYYLTLMKNGVTTCSASDITLSKGAEPVQAYTLINDQNNNGILDTGDEIAFGSEHFYVISNTKGNIKALAKYNLYVGGTYRYDTYDTSDISDPARYTPYGSEATGLQDSGMVGRNGSNNGAATYTGVMRFQNESSNPNYETSLVKPVVDTYVEYLNSHNPNANISGRLLTKEEFDYLGCDGSPSNDATNRCYSHLSWVNNNSYWGMTKGYGNNVWSVGFKFYYNSNARKYNFGVRPVIEFYDSFQASKTPNYNLYYDANQNGGLDSGDFISVNNELFIITGSTNGHIFAQSAYNLNVGNSLVPDAPVGIQHIWAKGYTNTQDAPYYGCVTFANQNTWPYAGYISIDLRSVPGEINTALYAASGYENYIKTYMPNITMHLMTLEDLHNMGYPEEPDLSWMPQNFPMDDRFATSFWIGYTYDNPTKIPVMYSNGVLGLNEYNVNSGTNCLGVRPLIEFDL